ncbi:hypothetical protein SAMN05660745_00796, partial [Corynebacterium glucuronolyticum]
MNTILGVYQGWSVAKLVRGGADPAHARVIKKLSGIYFGTTSATVK